MAIRFRCEHCGQLMSITSRKAGQTVPCPACAAQTVVPYKDVFEQEAAAAAAEEPAEPVSPVLTPASHRLLEPVGMAGEDVAQPPAWGTDEEDAGEEPVLSMRRAQTEFEDMDLTPMVDVTFLLLIFFMITASFSLQKTIQVPAPDPEQQGATQSIQLDDLQATSILVDIDSRDAVYVDDVRVADLDRLAESLRDKMRLEQKTELVITADNSARHATVVKVVDAANEVGMQRIRLANTGGRG